MKTQYHIASFQKTYFIIKSFQQLFNTLRNLSWEEVRKTCMLFPEIAQAITLNDREKYNRRIAMNKICELSKKKCIPCHGGTPPLEPKEIAKLLKDLPSKWLINESGHLFKVYTFPNFVDAMDFANQITAIAEQEAHHPDLHISYGKCIVKIWTHKINGLTESDFILAAKIEGINHE